MKLINLVLSVGFICCVSLVFADVINVPADQSTIQAGIDAAVNSDTVLVQPGIYYENVNFNGKLITVGSLFLTTQSTSYISSTIIDGSNIGRVVTLENGEDSTAVLCGFTITNGYHNNGGGIYCYGSSLSIQNVTISGNSANYGGGILCDEASPNLHNVTIMNNSANSGSGIYCHNYSSPRIQNVTITDNSATYIGGGIYCYESSPILQNVTITNNSATSIGGGIYLLDSNPSLENVIVKSNSATSNGGGIYCYNSNPSLKDVEIRSNSADHGGGIHIWNSNPSLEDVEIIANTANYGGGIYCDGSSPNLKNVIIAGHFAYQQGGGICCKNNSSPSLQNVTIDINNSGQGGGIYCENSSPILINSILWDNSPQEIYIESGSVTATYSDIMGGWTGTGNIDDYPLYVDPGNRDYHLQPTSPCINVGDPTSPLDPDGTIADIGAYYYHHHFGPVWLISTTGSDVTGDGSEQFPFATIQHGINVSSDTDTVLVKPGTYTENIDFNGKLITVGSLFLTTQDTSYISSTTIDGNSNGCVVTFNNGEDSSANICGFTITNGYASYGGGISCNNSSCPNLTNLKIIGNSAVYNGGGIYCLNDSNPGLENVIITGNSAVGYGGGIYCYNASSPDLQNITITDNSADYGGGIYCRTNSNPDLKNVIIDANSANRGGGIYSHFSHPNLGNVTITGNSAVDYGGGIYCYSSTSSPSIINSILWNDSPEEIYITSGSVAVTYSDIEGGWVGTGNINSYPLFVDPGNGDCHLHSGSPCIDAGDPASPLDPDGTLIEMGACFFPQFIISDFTVDTTIGYIPLTVNFTDLSVQGTGGEIDEWYWDFGDGNISYLQNPANEYLSQGNYTVSLTVTDVNDSTDTETKVDYITVNPPAYSGPIWNISTTGSDEWGNGSTQYPFITIQQGINASSNTDTVLVQPGIYIEKINYNGKMITVGSLFLINQNPVYISSTTIDGNSSGSVVTFSNSEDSTTVLCGFTITNGLGDGSPNYSGGGITCRNLSNPRLENLTITSNFATIGGGIYCRDDSSPSLESVKIIDNSALDDGGGVCFVSSSPNLEYVTISGNSAESGGGICCRNSNLVLKNITIIYNSADFGGGIYCGNNSSPIIRNVTITNNSATSNGGGFCSFNSSPYLINSILWNNSPDEIYIPVGSFAIGFSDIEGGWTGPGGGGNIDDDPIFVNPGGGDYRLQPVSPCIDTGDPDPIYNDPDATRADMGSYFFNQYNGPIWHVSKAGSDETGSGSEQYPFASIQHGIDISADTDTVLVNPGFYVENINFYGKLITVGSLFLTTQDITYISATTIDGNQSGSVVTFSNGEDSSANICGFTIKNGNTSYGGGIKCLWGSSPSLGNLILSINSAIDGGGIYCQNNSNPILQNVIIADNSAVERGGGIYCQDNSNPILQNVIIADNSAVEWGGGIYFKNSSSILINSILWNNSSDEIFIESGSISIAYSDIEGGYAGTGNIDSDPLFVNPGSGNYHLQPGSPCIDAGDPVSPLDPDGTVADMGVFYYDQHFGSVWHVSTIGSDITGSGSEQYPFASIQHGIDFSADTDTVLVQPGTYVENINFNGKLITVGSLLLTTQDTSYISSTIIDGNSSGNVVKFYNNEDTTAVLSGFTITNGSGDYGGGIDLDNSSPRLDNLIITNNSVNLYGGGVICYLSNPILQNITISDNSAEYGGGIMFWSCDDPSLENVIISGNTASIVGGGLHCYNNSNPNLTNVSIIENTAYEDGGGIYCYVDCNPSIENVTISNNTAYINGGGICLNNSNTNLINSILWNDSPDEIYIYSGSVTASYSDIQGGNAGIGNIDSDPLFVDPNNGDYYLQLASPCVDAGDPSSPLDPDGSIVEMGAFYFPRLPPIADFTVDITTGEVPLMVNFTDLSTQGSGVINNWFWDFGGGNNSSLQNPSNEYSLPGIYTVLLTVSDVNDSTDTETKVDYITVHALPYSGPVWHISTTGSDVTGNGSEQYPFATIQHGINASSDTDTVLVQPGTYVENINYNGKLITIGSLFLTTQDISYISQTIIDGDTAGSVVTFDTNEDSNAVLCGFTITNGLADYGGGIYCGNISTPSLENVIITGNSTSNNGGGIYCVVSKPILKNVTISDNSADLGLGGGIYCGDSSPGLENVTITGNSANNGGGIYCYLNSSPSLLNSILWNNSPQEIYIEFGSVTATYSDIEGGFSGTGNIDSDPLFANTGSGNYHLQPGSPCLDVGDPASPLDPDGTIADMGAHYYHQYSGPVWHVSTTGSDLAGGGTEQYPFATIQHGIDISSNTDTVLVHPGTYTENINFNGKLIKLGSLYLTTQDTGYISSTIIDGNNSGSVVIFENGENESAILKGLTITNGHTYAGGGIGCWYSSSPGLENLVVSNNIATLGGGIYLFNNASPILQYVTITNNIATANGGGMDCNNNCFPSLINVTMSGNSANYGGGIFCLDSYPVFISSILWNDSPQEIYVGYGAVLVSYSDIQGGWSGTGNISSNPLFIDPGNGDYRLQTGSPCIDAGDPSSPSDPDGSIVDMGAHYFTSRLNLKVILHGPFNGTNMNIDLNSFGLIPTNQPYNVSPWNYNGAESVTSIASNVVDWVLIELRDAPNAISATQATIIDQQALFLRGDGLVMDMDGLSDFQFNGSINQQLFVVIRHRNHIDVMSADPLQKSGGVYSYDFTTIDQAFGLDATIPLGAGAYGMYSGDVNADRLIDEFDKSGVWIFEAGRFDYLPSDLNLDGQSNNIDKNDFWFMNRDNDCQVPE